MLRRRLTWFGIFLAAGTAAALWMWPHSPQPPVETPSVSPAAANGPPGPEPLVGEAILKNYASASTTVREDLLLLDQLLTNFRLLIKRPDALPLGSNAEIAQALRGESRNNKEPFLPSRHPSFNPAGELIDRWGDPLFFHAESRDRISIRSAGPDREMWTEDDVVRQADGSYQMGAALGYSGVTPR